MARSPKSWEAESDANTLAQAAQINADKVRLGRAKRAAVQLAKDEAPRLTTLRRLAKTAPKAPRRRSK